MRKIVALLISLLLVIGVIPNVWAISETDDTPKREILDALGIMNIDNDSEFVTRKEFFNGLLHMSYDSFEEESIQELLAVNGILSDSRDSVFAKDNYISYNDAIAAVVTVLGYDQIAMWNGEYTEGYKKVAQDIGILKGVIGNRTLSIDRESLVNLFYNAIRVEPCVISFESGGTSYKTASGETVLSMQRKIYEVSGIVEANQYTSLTGENGNRYEQITIGGENYYINGTNAGDLLGSYVKGYIQKPDSDDGKVIFMSAESGRTSELIIDSKDILSVSTDCRDIEYQRSENSSAKHAKISVKVRVIYNGKFYDGYTNSDLHVQNGYLRLVDNDSDNEYDCVFITSYETMIVEYVNAYSYEIYGKYKYSGAVNYLKLEDPEDNQNIHYYLADQEVQFNEISKDDILTVQKSKGSSEFCANIYISRNVISEKATAFDADERTIKIADNEYRVLQCCIDEINAIGGFDLATDYLFYMDNFGKLAYVMRTQTTDYCLFYRIREDRRSGEYNIDYLNDNSEWIKAPLAKKVRYNDIGTKANVVFGYLSGCDPQVMVIKCNQRGEISTIMTANATSNFTQTSETTRRYRSTPKTFDCDLYLESDARVFVFPQTASEGQEGYFVATSSYLAGNGRYSMSAYDVDEYNFTKAISIKENTDVKDIKKRGWLIVNKIVTKLNDDNEVVTAVSGVMGSYFNVEFEGVDNTVFNGVSKGAIIRIGLNKDNKAESWDKIEDSISATPDLWQDPVVIDGRVVSCDSSGGKLKLNRSGTDYHLRCNSSTNVLIYTKGENSIKAGNTAELVPGDNVYITLSWAIPQTIMVIRN